MRLRLFAVAAFAAILCGCAQRGGTMPSMAPSSGLIGESAFSKEGPPALKLFGTPTKASWPEYIVPGPKRSMWFSEFYSRAVGRIAMNGKITEFPLPYGDDIEGITVGADGNIWFTEPGANKIGRMTPQGAMVSFTVDAYNPSPRGITRGPDGNVWYVEYYDGYIGRVTPQGVITRFAIPQYASSPWAIVTGPDGDLWFTESDADLIGRFNPAEQRFDAPIAIPTQNATPWGIIVAPDKHVWFTERTGNKIGKVLSSGKVREFTIAQEGSYPDTLAPGGGNLWFTETLSGKVAAIDLKTGAFGPVVTLPDANVPIGIAQGPNKNVWFCISSDDQPMQIGELVLR